MRRFISAPNALSIAGLLSSWAGVLAAAKQHRGAAFAMLALAGTCDLLDGPAARRRGSDAGERRFGSHLDSLVDACAFGFAPTLVLYLGGHTGAVEIVVLAAFLTAAIWRLAYFETAGLQSGVRGPCYTGLPVTYAALCFPVAALAFRSSPALERWVLDGVMVGLTILMVSPIRIPKPVRLGRIIAIAVVLLMAGYVAGGSPWTGG